MGNINTITSVLLTQEQIKFFKEKHIKMSPFVRDLIDNSEDYKRWKEEDKK